MADQRWSSRSHRSSLWLQWFGFSRRPKSNARRSLGQKSLPASGAWKRTVRRRVVVAALGLILWTIGIQARLVYLQVSQYEVMLSRATRQQMRTVNAPAKRGDILDRRGRILAYSVDADSIYAVPAEIENPEEVAASLCSVLQDCSSSEQRLITERLGRPRAFTYIRRQVSPDEAASVAALNLKNVGFLKENRRYYPKRNLAAHLLGYVGVDNIGLGGIESSYDERILGRPGKLLIHTDARHQAFSRIERPPTAGENLELSIDQNLQHIAQRELVAAVQANRASGGTVIVMNPHTGEILALANEPTFNPNVFNKFSEDIRRNRAVQEVYEPGSTFKIVTASAALEERIIKPDSLIDVSDGMIQFGPRKIRDVYRYGTLSFSDVIVKSSNVGAIKVGLELGSDRLSRYVRRFGFGQTLSPDFRGESRGIVWKVEDLDPGALASVSMGYQIGVTPLQMVSAVSAIANGGRLIEPRVVSAFVRNGERVTVKPRIIRRVVEPGTAVALTQIMEGVVERGSGRSARIEGYTVAGKTGTAAKLHNGRYSKTNYMSSFVGFAPSRDPAITILVVIDSPSNGTYYGGAVAAPVFKTIAEEVLRYLHVGPNLNAPLPVIVTRWDSGNQMRPLEIDLSRGQEFERERAGRGKEEMPDLHGLSARQVLRVLSREGIWMRLVGDGFSVSQFPTAGAPLPKDVPAIVWFRRDGVGQDTDSGVVKESFNETRQ